ncbi:MAG TPA: SxtJ family membrane protein [Gemmatimonadaceae bacterium]|nr:SxtJ family membrane protein [Gemmatimonadaceae bacterium]
MSRAEARRFGFTLGAAFLVLAGILWWRDRGTAAAITATIGGGLVLAGAIVPGVLPPVYRGWMLGAERLSRVTTPVILGIIYFLVITPTGLILRALGRNPLTTPRPDETVWTSRPPGTRRGDLRRQF